MQFVLRVLITFAVRPLRVQ